LLSGCAGLGDGSASDAGRAAAGDGAATGSVAALTASALPATVAAVPDAPLTPAAPVVAPPPTWRALSSGPLETWTERRTPLYTYVLAGDIATPPVPAGQAEKKAANKAANKAPQGPKQRAQRVMARLLLDVQADSFPEGPEADVALAAVHQFLVPAWPRTARTVVTPGDGAVASGMPSGALTLADVDLIKSQAHLDVLRVVLAGQPAMAQRLRGLGPFLVTTRQPLGELVRRRDDGVLVVADRSPVLLIDLAQRNDSTLMATVRSLKVVVRDAQGQTGAIGPLRARLLARLRATGVAVPHVAESRPPGGTRAGPGGPTR
jgi:hypothetical protein